MHVTDADGVRWITLDRPDKRNALTPETVVDVAETVEAAGADEVDAIAFAGEGPAFCAGGDVEAMAERDWPAADRSAIVADTFGRLATAMLEAEVPLVARVNGDAVGAGLALVALCDFAFAAEDARFSAGFARLGLIPDAGGTFLLPALVGLRTAKRLALTAAFIDAAEAADVDLLSAAVPADDLDDRVDACLTRLGALPTETLGRIRRAMHANLGRPYGDALAFEAHRQAEAYATAAHAEGVRSFLE